MTTNSSEWILTANEINDPYMLSALRIKETITPAESIGKALHVIEEFHGWKATLETASNISFDKYKEALHKRIPILLKNNRDNTWRLCIGYIRHDNQDMLILINPALFVREDPVFINNQRIYPGAGLYFDKFDPQKFQPYFIHNWHVSVARLEHPLKRTFAKAIKSQKEQQE